MNFELFLDFEHLVAAHLLDHVKVLISLSEYMKPIKDRCMR